MTVRLRWVLDTRYGAEAWRPPDVRAPGPVGKEQPYTFQKLSEKYQKNIRKISENVSRGRLAAAECAYPGAACGKGNYQINTSLKTV